LEAVDELYVTGMVIPMSGEDEELAVEYGVPGDTVREEARLFSGLKSKIEVKSNGRVS